MNEKHQKDIQLLGQLKNQGHPISLLMKPGIIMPIKANFLVSIL